VDAAVSTGEPQYLMTDTHWTPEAADLVAKDLAATVGKMIDLSKKEKIQFTSKEIPAGNVGDLAEMLELASLFPGQTVDTAVVNRPNGEPWQGARSAEVLLLGDSFANIYHEEQLGWGANAGLAQRLAYHLQRPVDALIRNDDGAFTKRLAGTKIVIWEFTARELSVGDWRSVPISQAVSDSGSFVVPAKGNAIVVEGTVAALAEVPNPRTAPYADFIVGMHLVDLESDDVLDGDQAMVFTWAMRNRRLTAGARYRVGQRLRLELRPWADVTREFGVVTRGELFENDLFLQAPCWGEEVTP
jgi:alginate O-acetyltransferase complex protein AlgJ